jgi:hypothetical protein
MDEGTPMPEPVSIEKIFAVIAEVQGYPRQLVLLDLPFGRLMDEVVVPYENADTFFIDGVPATKQTVQRIKIVELGANYSHGIHELERGMTRGDKAKNKTYGDQYNTRFEHVLRTTTTDVTAQVVKAYSQVIKPSMKNYLPQREELIGTATRVFIEGMKVLGGS